MNEINENTKFYINNTGIYFTGQILSEFIYDKGFFRYFGDVEILGFHRKKRKKSFGYDFYFTFKELNKKRVWSLNCDELGKRFIIKGTTKT